jgi:hypothetical protein
MRPTYSSSAGLDPSCVKQPILKTRTAKKGAAIIKGEHTILQLDLNVRYMSSDPSKAL